MKLDQLFSPYTRINSKWIKDLNVRLNTIKTLEENIGGKISGVAHSNNLSDIPPQARETKDEISKRTCIRLQAFAQQRGPRTKWRDNPLSGERSCR